MIYLDACLLIYLVEQHPIWSKPVSAAMAHMQESSFGISPLVKCECLVGPIRQDNHTLQRAYTDLFLVLVTLEMPEQVYMQAARLRAKFELKMPDALHLACAQHHGCEALWTNDDRLVRASEGLARRIPAS